MEFDGSESQKFLRLFHKKISGHVLDIYSTFIATITIYKLVEK